MAAIFPPKPRAGIGQISPYIDKILSSWAQKSTGLVTVTIIKEAPASRERGYDKSRQTFEV